MGFKFHVSSFKFQEVKEAQIIGFMFQVSCFKKLRSVRASHETGERMSGNLKL